MLVACRRCTPCYAAATPTSDHATLAGRNGVSIISGTWFTSKWKIVVKMNKNIASKNNLEKKNL